MEEYLFYTAEGVALSPNGQEVENMQVLGRASGNSEAEALARLVEENPWIREAGFNPKEAMSAIVARR